MTGLITKEMEQKARQAAIESGFKAGDKIRLRATGMRGTILSGPGYMGEFTIHRDSGKHKGTTATWSCDEFILDKIQGG